MSTRGNAILFFLLTNNRVGGKNRSVPILNNSHNPTKAWQLTVPPPAPGRMAPLPSMRRYVPKCADFIAKVACPKCEKGEEEGEIKDIGDVICTPSHNNLTPNASICVCTWFVCSPCYTLQDIFSRGLNPAFILFWTKCQICNYYNCN